MSKTLGEPSTYTLLIAAPLLARFNIHLSHQSLRTALSDHASIYSQLLRVPVLNIFNGIIFQQTHDYQVYLQKLLIDYRLSAEYAKEQDAPGAGTRRDLDEYFDTTAQLVNAFNEQQFNHYQLISQSQACLIQATKSIKNPSNDLEKLLDDPAFTTKLNEFVAEAEQITIVFNDYRQRFYDLILQTSDSLRMLSDYRPDEQQIEVAREGILFEPLTLDKHAAIDVSQSL